jgi:hypothetical protein
MRRGKPIHLPERINDTDFSIVAQYQAEYRGVVNYYLMAFNVHRLWRLHWIAQTSLLKTLANKFRTSVRDVQRRYSMTVELPHGPQKVLEVVIDRGPKKKPLVTRFGGIELRWQRFTHLNDKPKKVYSGRSEIVDRLLADECELCGSEGNCEVHHIRKLADLSQPGQSDKPLWVKRMAARRRNTLVVCQHCHHEIHGAQSGKE